MGTRIRSRLTFANVVSLLALFIALGGSSYAVVTRVGTKEIRNNSVRTGDLRNNDIRSRDVRNGTLLRGDFKSGQLPAGATGAQGPRGLKGDPGTSVFGSTIPSGTTIRGSFAINDVANDNDNTAFAVGAVSFPVPAPAVPAAVNFAPGTTGADDDATCTGTALAPTAPGGKVCLYPNSVAAADNTGNGDADGTPFGFRIRIQGHADNPSRAFAAGNWAYTAP